jgi:CubicO group peptidase (beta-lactamase class C family)
MTNAVVRALAQIDSWSAPHPGAAVVNGSGRTSMYGDVMSVSRIASVTKPLFAYAVLVAVEEGIVELDEPVPRLPEQAGPATIRHLLAHAGGLPFLESEGVPIPIETRRIYSNWGFDLLGELLAERSEMAVAEYLYGAVFEPLAMVNTSLQGSVAKDVFSNVIDLGAFVAELQRPTLIDVSTWTDLTTIQFPDLIGLVPGFGTYRPCPWGLGVEIRGQKDPHWTGRNNSPETFGHFGQTGSMLWVDPRNDVALVSLSGREFGQWAGPCWTALSDDVLAACEREREVGSVSQPS